MWRPKDWKPLNNPDLATVYEAGADAILEALKNGNSFRCSLGSVVSKQLKAHGDICYKAGMKEVVEWMRVTSVVKHYEYTDDKGKKWMGVSFCITPKQWQAKLKEWRIT